MPVKIFVGGRPLESLTPAERTALGQRIAEDTMAAALDSARRMIEKQEQTPKSA